mgnify:CR=1 FL=1
MYRRKTLTLSNVTRVYFSDVDAATAVIQQDGLKGGMTFVVRDDGYYTLRCFGNLTRLETIGALNLLLNEVINAETTDMEELPDEPV